MKLNQIDLNKFSIFCSVVENGNYQRASEALHVTPSALSQTISSLEHQLGFPLFDRVGRRLLPTKNALRLHREFRIHEVGFLRAVEEVRGTSSRVGGLLRVGAYLEFAKSQLTAPIREFLRDFPDTQLKMVFEPPTRLHSLVEQGQLDLCFSIFPAREKKAIRSERIYEEELVLIAPPQLLPQIPTFEQVVATPMIEYFANHQPIQRWLALHYQRRPKKIPVRVFAATAEMVVSLVKEGAGIGVVPAYLTESPELQRQVRIIRPTNRKLNDYIWLLERYRKPSPLHAVFRERLLKNF